MEAFIVRQVGGWTLVKGLAVEVLQERGNRVNLVCSQELFCSTLQLCALQAYLMRIEEGFWQTYM